MVVGSRCDTKGCRREKWFVALLFFFLSFFLCLCLLCSFPFRNQVHTLHSPYSPSCREKFLARRQRGLVSTTTVTTEEAGEKKKGNQTAPRNGGSGKIKKKKYDVWQEKHSTAHESRRVLCALVVFGWSGKTRTFSGRICSCLCFCGLLWQQTGDGGQWIPVTVAS